MVSSDLRLSSFPFQNLTINSRFLIDLVDPTLLCISCSLFRRIKKYSQPLGGGGTVGQEGHEDARIGEEREAEDRR